MDISLQKEIEQIRVVEAKRNYWFIRTYSGKLYDFFRENDFVGIGFNNVPYKYIEEASLPEESNPVENEETKFSDLAAFKRLQNFISANTEYKKGRSYKVG